MSAPTLADPFLAAAAAAPQPLLLTESATRATGSKPIALRGQDGRATAHLAVHPLSSGGAFGSARAVVFVETVQAAHAVRLRGALVTA